MSGSTSNKNKKDMKSSKTVDNMKEEIGQGELYSPNHAIKINTNKNNQENNYYHREELEGNTMMGRGVGNDIKNKMSMVKERLMEKLAAASVPSDALENTRHFFESVIKDVTVAAHGLTKEAIQKIKSHLADIVPSLSPSLTSKMVDDAEKEARAKESGDEGNKEISGENKEEHKGKTYTSNIALKLTSKL